MKSRIDLHIHTTASDGLHTPAEIVEMARRKGLRVLSITDHDTVKGVAPAIEVAGDHLEVVPGVEISAYASGREIHILGYFFDYQDQLLIEALARLCQSRLGRAERMIEKLRALGVAVSRDRVLEIAGEGAIGRPHIAQALREANHVHTIQEAFDRFLSQGRPSYVPRYNVTQVQAMRLLHNAGGVPVLAHPWNVTSVIPHLVAEGLVGLETYYTGYNPMMIAYLRRLAQQHDLICTGGSDFHGLALLAENHLGQVYVPPGCVAALRAKSCAGREAD